MRVSPRASISLTGTCVRVLFFFFFCPRSCQGRECPTEVVCLCWRCWPCNSGWVCVVRARVRVFLSEPSRRRAWFSHREATAVADHYRERDSGRWEFSGVCLRLGPLLNERCSISLIMLLRLMSLFSHSKECKKALLLFWAFCLFNWAK